MYCSKVVLYLALFLAFLAQSFLAAGNIIFNALVSLCKNIIFRRVIRSETRCCKFALFLAFLAVFFLFFGLFLNANLALIMRNCQVLYFGFFYFYVVLLGFT